jgi:hypothetical protein
MTAPPKEKAAQDQPGGKASSACTINKTHGGVPVKLPVTEREVADQARRGRAKLAEFGEIVRKLKRWRPGNDALIERVTTEVWNHEERYGEPWIVRIRRVWRENHGDTPCPFEEDDE